MLHGTTHRTRALAWGPHALTYRLRFFAEEPAAPAPDPAPAAPPPTEPPAAPPAPGSPPPAPAAIVNPDGTYIDGWLTHSVVPEECRNNAQLLTHKGLGDTLKNWATLEKLRGAHVVPVPPEGADDAAWNVVHDRLGRPKEPTGYTMPDLAAAGLDPKDAAPPEFIAEVQKIAHTAGLTDRQFGKWMAGYNQLVAATLKANADAQTTAKAAAMQQLATAWPGQTFAANKALAAAHLKSTVPPADLPAIEALGLLDNPITLKWLHAQAVRMTELEPDLETVVPTGVAAAAQTEIAKLEADPNGPLYQEHDPGHKEAAKRHRELLAVVARAKAGAA